MTHFLTSEPRAAARFPPGQDRSACSASRSQQQPAAGSHVSARDPARSEAGARAAVGSRARAGPPVGVSAGRQEAARAQALHSGRPHPHHHGDLLHHVLPVAQPRHVRPGDGRSRERNGLHPGAVQPHVQRLHRKKPKQGSSDSMTGQF